MFRFIARRLAAVAVAAGCLVVAACSSEVPCRGRVLKSGPPLKPPPPRGIVRVQFHGDKGPYDILPVSYNTADGSFVASGRTNTYVPRGKYKLSVEVFDRGPVGTDALGGRFAKDSTPIAVDVDGSTIDIELDDYATPKP